MLGDVGHVFGRLEPPFDLEARHPQLDQTGDQVERREVLGAQQVLDVAQVADLAVADDLIGQAARLGTFATVGRPPAEGLTGQALARVRHAERSVDEDLDGQLGGLTDLGDLIERQLSGQDHPRSQARGPAGLPRRT